MLYSSIENEKIKSIKKLNQKKYRDLYNKFLVEGDHLVKEAYKANCLETIVIVDNYDLAIDVNKMIVTEKVMNYISELSNHQKVIGICNEKYTTNYGNRILIIDGVQDPGNLGTIIRSAVAFNIDTIILSNDTVDLYNSKVIRASQGMLFNVNIVIKSLKEEIEFLKKLGYIICSTKVTDGNAINSLKKYSKLAIVVGNEGYGVSDNILENSDEFIHIPMNKQCESLNVGVATSILLYEINK